MIKSWRDMNAVAQNVAMFPTARQKNRDWSAQELAEFYRVENALVQSGMRIVTDRGVTDEGDPWFLFCREVDGEPIVHFARTDGYYVIASPAYEGITRGDDLRAMVKEMIERHKLSLTAANKNKSNIQIHPAALLIVLVGAAFFKTPSTAHADELKKDDAHGQKGELSAPALLRSYGLSHWQSAETDMSSSEDVILRNLWMIASTAVASSHDEVSQIQDAGNNSVGDIVDQGSASVTYQQAVSGTHSDQPLLKDGSSAAADTHYPTLQQWVEQKVYNFVDLVKSTQELGADNSLAFMHETSPTLVNSSQGAAPFINLNGRVSHDAASIPSKLFALSSKFDAYSDATSQNVTVDKGSQSKVAEPSTSSSSHDVALVDQTPATLKSSASMATAPQQQGAAASFLNDNKILLALKVEKPSDNTSSTAGDKTPPAGTDNTKSTTSDTKSAAIDTKVTASDIKSVVVTEAQLTGPNVQKLDGSVILDNSHPQETLSTEVFLKTLSAFIQEGKDVHLSVSNGSYIFADSTNGSVLDSITATFNDGSAISIVGQHQLLHDIISHFA